MDGPGCARWTKVAGKGRPPPAKRRPDWARGGAGLRGTCCKKETKEESEQLQVGMDVNFRLRGPGPHSSPGPGCSRALRPVETSRPKGFSWEGSPRLWLPEPPLAIFGIFVQIDFDVGSGNITLFIFISPNSGPPVALVFLYYVQCLSFNY